MQYNTYDVSFKFAVIEEYQKENKRISFLSRKYGVPRTTIYKWIDKYKNFNGENKENIFEIDYEHRKLNPTQLPLSETFLDITPHVKTDPKLSDLTITINGYSITTDTQGIKAIMEAIKQ